MSVDQAQQLMFRGHALAPLPARVDPEQIAAIESDSGVKVYAGSLRAWKGEDGYFFVDQVIGKHDLITYAVALSADGKVRQVEILEYREAYGGEVRNAHWRGQFVGRHHGDAVRAGATSRTSAARLCPAST